MVEAGPEADLEAVGAQEEGLQPVKGLVGREVAQEAHNYEAFR
jgi:hypothetical protein